MDEILEAYPKDLVLSINVILITILAVAAYGMRGLWGGYVSIIYVGVFVIMTFFILRKLICTNCYYYDKWCGTGWGKLAAKLFKKGTGNDKIGGMLALFNWMLWFTLLPVVTMAYILWTRFSYGTLATLAIFIVLIMVNHAGHNKCCFHCKEKKTCVGSKYREK